VENFVKKNSTTIQTLEPNVVKVEPKGQQRDGGAYCIRKNSRGGREGDWLKEKHITGVLVRTRSETTLLVRVEDKKHGPPVAGQPY